MSEAPEDRGKEDQSTNDLLPLSPLRTILAIVCILTLVFVGLCTLIAGSAGIVFYGMWGTVFLYGGLPITASVLTLWAVMRWRRVADKVEESKS